MSYVASRLAAVKPSASMAASVSEYLLAEGHVNSVTGTAYGLSPFFRISTATSDEILTEATARIGRGGRPPACRGCR